VFSRHATRVELLLFDHVDEAKAARVIRIDPIENRTYHYWHVFVPRVTAGQLYGFRVEGPSDPGRGMRFDPASLTAEPLLFLSAQNRLFKQLGYDNVAYLEDAAAGKQKAATTA